MWLIYIDQPRLISCANLPKNQSSFSFILKVLGRSKWNSTLSWPYLHFFKKLISGNWSFNAFLQFHHTRIGEICTWNSTILILRKFITPRFHSSTSALTSVTKPSPIFSCWGNFKKTCIQLFNFFNGTRLGAVIKKKEICE